MKNILLYIIMILTAVPFAYAEEQTVEKQRYVVASKKGQARFVPVVPEGDKWLYAPHPREDLILENGVELEGFKVEEDRSLNFKGTNYAYNGGIVVEYQGKYYIAVAADKNIKPIDENGNVTSGLGFRNYLSNTFIGDFYRTWRPCVIGLACALLAGIFILMSFTKANVPMVFRWGYAAPMCVITVLELGAFLSVGTDATWWVNPEDVGYWIATPMLIPYAIAAAMMIYSYKLYKMVGKLDGFANIIVSVLLIIGIVLTVVSAIFVVCDFVAAVLPLIGLAWMFKGIDHKDAFGNTINSGPLGTYKTDRYGNTTRID